MSDIDKYFNVGNWNNEGLSDKEKMKLWISNYCKEKYNDKWKLGLSWSFGKGYKKFSNMEYWMDNLGKYMMSLSGILMFDGLYVGEYNSNNDMHLHSTIYYDSVMSDNDVKNKLWKYCSNKGSVDIIKFDEEEIFEDYMTKYLYDKNENMFNMIRNKI